MKKLTSLFLVLIFSALFIVNNTFATTEWPNNIGNIEADSAIVIDARSGCLLYGKNIHEKSYPASITKILTALIVLENCKLDDTITFSHNAVYNVDPGSSSAGYDEGDSITVNDALHVMLLKSANEVANALAEHCSGSIEEFAKLMNAKAKSLGATESNFTNPSGLNDTNHYTTAYDFALISREAFKNPTLREIAGKTYYKLPASKNNPDGFSVYVHHAMLRNNSENYYEYAKAGKTGYTKDAGNTLVTYADNGNISLVSVVLGSKQTHYADTKTLLEFGFNNFKSISLSNGIINYDNLISNLHLVGSNSKLKGLIKLSSDDFVTLPKQADMEETDMNLSYELDATAPKNALAKIDYTLQDHNIGTIYLLSDNLSNSNARVRLDNTDINKKPTPFTTIKYILSSVYFIIAVIIIILLSIAFSVFYFIRYRNRKRSKLYLERLRSKRRKTESFNKLIDSSLNIDFPKSPVGLVRDVRSRKKKGFTKK